MGEVYIVMDSTKSGFAHIALKSSSARMLSYSLKKRVMGRIRAKNQLIASSNDAHYLRIFIDSIGAEGDDYLVEIRNMGNNKLLQTISLLQFLEKVKANDQAS